MEQQIFLDSCQIGSDIGTIFAMFVLLWVVLGE